MKHLKKVFMWYKVKELSETGLNKSQIARELGIYRATVRRYLGMEEEEFHKWLEQPRHFPAKLAGYHDFIKNQLMQQSFLSAAQIEDRLKEHFPGKINVHSKTIYNFVQQIRRDNNLPKPKKDTDRAFQKLADTDYGAQAQVDFGEFNIQTNTGTRIKVYFFAMVLSRSRQKFVWFSTVPFTSTIAIEAHQKAFLYYQGVPKQIIYDQDKVFLKDENLGDFILTKEFGRFVESEPFSPIFCRKSDPQSKGKIENVVGYVKKNFLRGRIFYSLDQLNKDAIAWLERTANAKRHGTTWEIPIDQWNKEKPYLLPIKSIFKFESRPSELTYKVRKDNTITYKGNYYSLPIGTYKGQYSQVIIKLHKEMLQIFNMKHQPITEHQVSHLKGRLISKTDHSRDKSKSIKQREDQVRQLLGNSEKGNYFLQQIKTGKPRYYHDNLRLIIRKLKEKEIKYIELALDFCLENELYNANRLAELVKYYRVQDQDQIPHSITRVNLPQKAYSLPQTSNINTYESLIKNI
ncbi:MAG TPA: IS21 family transposase [Bacteroidales bacterium]|nr:IS21 family transposase [Bacteroidales bacterium]